MKRFDRSLLPELLVTSQGEKVDTASKWETLRKPEILAFFQKEVYGRLPAAPLDMCFSILERDSQALDGKAVRETINIHIQAEYGAYDFPFFMFIPKRRHAVPAALLISNRSKDENLDVTRRIRSDFWPVEQIVDRGIAACAFYALHVDTDANDGFVNGIHPIFTPRRTKEDWATLASWAWGAMRIMDYFETDSRIDEKRVAVVGQSRGGKTAILAGAMDERFAAVYSSCSGCVGAALSRFKDGEHFEDILASYPYWFCENFAQYAGREQEMPFDQDALLSCIAPRLLYVSSATMDDWADPEAELACLLQTSAVYALYGMKGLPESVMTMDRLKLLEKPLVSEATGYHRRVGIHDLTIKDWMKFLDFFQQRT